MRTVLGSPRYSALIGLLAAAVGFSYALATSNTDSAGIRSVTNPRQHLTFVNPFVPSSTDRDLGDAALGSTITRYIRASGGTPPYRFVSDRTTLGPDGTPLFNGHTTLGEAEIALPAGAHPSQSTTAVFLNGLLKGQIGDKTGTITDGTPLRFDVTVADSLGSNPNKHFETFRITLVDSSAFKFAQTTLSNGVDFRKYYDKLEVVAGNGPYTFSASNITLNGSATTPDNIAITSLSVLGLFLNKNTGVISGRPIYAGTYSFLATCVDSKGSIALSRDKSTAGQVIAFTVDENTRVSSELFSLKMSIKGDTNNPGKDSIKYSGLLDLGDSQVSDLDGLGVTLAIGNYTSPTVTLTGGAGSTAGPPAMSVKIGSDGSVSVSISGDSFGQAQSIITNSQLANNEIVLTCVLTIGDATNAAKPVFQNPELLRFSVKAKSSKFDLEYKFGPNNLGGGFLITSVAGKDDKQEDGDSWMIKFIALPPDQKKLSSFGTIVASTVGIGTDFTNSINCSFANQTVKSTEKRDPSQAVVLKVGFFDGTIGKRASRNGAFCLPNPTCPTRPPTLPPR